MSVKPADPFFVGYFKKVPKPIAAVALMAASALIGILVAQAIILPLSAADPGSGRYANDLKGAVLTGVIDPLPYPILRVAAAGETPARAILLGGQAKNGVQDRAAAAGAGPVEVGGIFVKRGDLDMLLVGGNGIKEAQDAPAFVPAAAVSLGHWRLTGEICDGKCYAGAMKPGTGLAHKACANLCVQSGLPPVLVMALPVEGSTVVLLADQDGGPMPDALLRRTAVPIRLDGVLERRDDLLVFRIDTGSARAPE